MALTLSYIQAPGTNPYENLALEACLTEMVPENTCIMYLWQNYRTVVIGRNQNPWTECHVAGLEADGGFLARRPSGGGAVFHDLGNLNFSFIARKDLYDVDQQLEVLIQAVGGLGVKAEKSGRNDVTIEGKKFSGNAFSNTKGHFCHHGTIMIHVDKEMLPKYLNVSPQKLKSKGVTSVKARVCNLTDFIPDLTAERMKTAMTAAFSKVYGSSVEVMTMQDVDRRRWVEEKNRLESWEWRFGRRIPFTISFDTRFSWGSLELELQLQEGKIVDALAYSDGLDSDFIAKIPAALIGQRFIPAEMAAAVSGIGLADEERRRMAGEVGDWMVSCMTQEENR